LSACSWCSQSDVELTSDHVFPRCIGGTLELSIPACRRCQELISQAERELARRSIFALHRIAGAPPPRRRNQAGRRVIEARYVLVKDAGMGGYQEVAMRVNELPVVLPSIEVDVSGEGGARLRGVQPTDVAQVAEALCKALDHQPDANGLLAEFDVELLEPHDRFYGDCDFWPRVYLDLAGELHIRARTGEEATDLIKRVIHAARQGVFHHLPGWNVGVVEAGTIHHFAIEYDAAKVHRVVAKIPAGMALLCYPSPLGTHPTLDELRRYVIGDPGTEGVRVEDISGPNSLRDAGEHHLAVAYFTPKSLRAVVVLYGGCFVVRVGTEQESPRLGACRRNHDDSKKWDGYPTTHPFSDRFGRRDRRKLPPSGIDEASDAPVRRYSDRLLVVAKCRVAGGSTRFVAGAEADEAVAEVRQFTESLGTAW